VSPSGQNRRGKKKEPAGSFLTQTAEKKPKHELNRPLALAKHAQSAIFIVAI
jgi:hypothetical protein